MKVDFSATLSSFDGTPLVRPRESADDPKTPWLAGELVADALMAPPPQGKPLTVGQATERYDLALSVFKGGKHEITAAQAVMIQEAAVRVLSPLAAAQIIKLTDGQKD